MPNANDEAEVPAQGAEALDIPRLLELCDKATPGPWVQAATRAHTDFQLSREMSEQEGDVFESGKWWGSVSDEITQRVDAAFIAAARTALPIALREIASLREQLAAAKQERDGMRVTSRHHAVANEHYGMRDHMLCRQIGQLQTANARKKRAIKHLRSKLEQARAALVIYADHKNWSCNRCKGHDHVNCCLSRWDGPLGKEEGEMCGEAHGYSIAEQAIDSARAQGESTKENNK